MTPSFKTFYMNVQWSSDYLEGLVFSTPSLRFDNKTLSINLGNYCALDILDVVAQLYQHSLDRVRDIII